MFHGIGAYLSTFLRREARIDGECSEWKCEEDRLTLEGEAEGVK